jgi:hypothetical protein
MGSRVPPDPLIPTLAIAVPHFFYLKMGLQLCPS